MASIYIRRQRRHPDGNSLIAALRTVNFMDALVSVLTLQNTLIMVNGTESSQQELLPPTVLSSGVIYTAIVAITLRMLWKGWKQA